MEIIERLIEKHHLNTSGVDIAVLTPYAAQRQLIKGMLSKSSNRKISKVVVSSIVESQGRYITPQNKKIHVCISYISMQVTTLALICK